MSYKPLDDRQVINHAALPNIGAPANDSLDDIFAKIDIAIAASSAGKEYTAKKIALSLNMTSTSVVIPVQADTSYVVLAIMGNTADAFPQYQQVQVTAKSTAGFTFSWNHPLDSNNYFLYYVIPYKFFPEAQVSAGLGNSSLSSTLSFPQPFAGYGIIAQLQNTINATPQFQTTVVGLNTASTLNLSWNVATDTSSYQETYMIQATTQVPVSLNATIVTINVPIDYGTTNFAVIATMQNTIDAHPQFQPIIVKAQTSGSATFGWNVATDTANYLLNVYAISLTT